MLSLVQRQLSLQSKSILLNSASSRGIVHRNNTDRETAVEENIQIFFLWLSIENVCVKLLILSELLKWIPAFPVNHLKENLIEGYRYIF